MMMWIMMMWIMMMWIIMIAECQADFHFVDQLQTLPPYQTLGRTCILSSESVDYVEMVLTCNVCNTLSITSSQMLI